MKSNKDIEILNTQLTCLDKKTSLKLAKFIKNIKAINEQIDLWKVKILKEMEDAGILKIEDENLSITYIAPTVRTYFDSKELKSAMPNVYEEFLTKNEVKASVRLNLKEQK